MVRAAEGLPALEAETEDLDELQDAVVHDRLECDCGTCAGRRFRSDDCIAFLRGMGLEPLSPFVVLFIPWALLALQIGGVA